jgi:hypothetical protein
MRDRATFVPPPAHLIVAPAPQNRGSLPPLDFPARHRRPGTAAPSLCWSRIQPDVRVMTPLPTSEEPGRSPKRSRIFFSRGSG